MKDKRNLKKLIEKEAKDYIKNIQTKEQEEIKSLLNVILCENKEALKELAK